MFASSPKVLEVASSPKEVASSHTYCSCVGGQLA